MKTSRPFLRFSINSSSKIPSSERNGSCLFSDFDGKGGTTILNYVFRAIGTSAAVLLGSSYRTTPSKQETTAMGMLRQRLSVSSRKKTASKESINQVKNLKYEEYERHPYCTDITTIGRGEPQITRLI